MRALTAALQTALGAPVQRPALLVRIDFSAPSRFTSDATLAWDSQTWTRADLDVQGLVVDALEISGTVVIGNADNVIGALLLNEGSTDKRVRIWGYDAAATALADVVLLGDAVGSTYSLTEREARIELRHRTDHVYGPRTYIGSETLGPLLTAGTVLRINGADYTLER
jgi:hypothetical protein